jgi:hypothetical protein
MIAELAFAPCNSNSNFGLNVERPIFCKIGTCFLSTKIISINFKGRSASGPPLPQHVVAERDREATTKVEADETLVGGEGKGGKRDRGAQRKKYIFQFKWFFLDKKQVHI